MVDAHRGNVLFHRQLHDPLEYPHCIVGVKWLVTEGLKAGDRVVISGLQKVRPGVQVKAQEVTADNNQQAASGAQPEQSKS